MLHVNISLIQHETIPDFLKKSKEKSYSSTNPAVTGACYHRTAEPTKVVLSGCHLEMNRKTSPFISRDPFAEDQVIGFFDSQLFGNCLGQ